MFCHLLHLGLWLLVDTAQECFAFIKNQSYLYLMCKDCRQSQRALATKDQSGAVKGSFLVLFRTRAVHCGRLAPRPGFGTPGGSGTPSGTQWWYMAHHGSVSSVGESAVQTVN